jgi:hypothetical protein
MLYECCALRYLTIDLKSYFASRWKYLICSSTEEIHAFQPSLTFQDFHFAHNYLKIVANAMARPTNKSCPSYNIPSPIVNRIKQRCCQRVAAVWLRAVGASNCIACTLSNIKDNVIRHRRQNFRVLCQERRGILLWHKWVIPTHHPLIITCRSKHIPPRLYLLAKSWFWRTIFPVLLASLL